MLSFLLCCIVIVAGYFTYSRLVEKIFAPDDRETPAVIINDGVDYVVLPQWKMFMIQLLNIAGLGPINGALSGAFWGPAVYLWITLGTVFAGCVHDYFSGMLSERNKGASISEIVTIYLGKGMGTVMRVFAVVLLTMIGTVFATGPAELITTLITNNGANEAAVYAFYGQGIFWAVIIISYYFISTFVSIEKIIGRIYPVFGVCLIFMAVGAGIGLIRLNGTSAEVMTTLYGAELNNYVGTPLAEQTFRMPEIWHHFESIYPANAQGTSVPMWSTMFITVACGAISGFHATQSPMMARCLKSERQGRFVFSGAMTAEGIIAMIWAAAGCTFFGSVGLHGGNGVILGMGNTVTVYNICKLSLGNVIGVAVAMLGVVACPITSGDTAFRSARLTLADWFKIDQGKARNRLLLTVPVLGVGAVLCFGNMLKYDLTEVVNGVEITRKVSYIDYQVIWRYFSWSNQTLAMIVLWAAAMYLAKERKNYWICVLPAMFMSAVSVTYFVQSNEGLGMFLNTYVPGAAAKTDATVVRFATHISYPAGIVASVLFFILFMWRSAKYRRRVKAAA
ncbi:MAG: carbon starvation protein A [Lachnospiraceae bacterium]|nr:carbon starvation protein A [Lachnospiraceae bacterium]